MKNIALVTLIALVIFSGVAFADTYGSTWNEGPLTLGKNKLQGDSVDGVSVDTDADGVTDIIFQADGDIELSGYTISRTDGTVGQALVTDGAGNVTFGTVAGGTTGTELSLSENLTVEKSLLVDNGTLYVSSSLDRVGIGTSTPSDKLDIQNDANMHIVLGDSIMIPSANCLQSLNAAKNGGQSFELRASNFYFYDADNDCIVSMLASNSIGINDSTPDATLDVTQTSAYTDLVSISTLTTSDVFHISEAGNVGIGTSSPTTSLYVNGTSYATNQLCSSGGGVVGNSGDYDNWYFSGNGELLRTSTIAQINIDSNNNQTDTYFCVAKDSNAYGAEKIFYVHENGNVDMTGDVSVSNVLTVGNNLYVTGTTKATTLNATGTSNFSGLVIINELNTITSIGAGAETTLESVIDHDDLNGFVAAEHIDWTDASDNISTSGNVIVGNDLIVRGDVTLENAGTFTGDVEFSDTLTADGLIITGDFGLANVLSPSDAYSNNHYVDLYYNYTGQTMYIYEITSWNADDADAACEIIISDTDYSSNASIAEDLTCSSNTVTVTTTDIDNRTVSDGQVVWVKTYSATGKKQSIAIELRTIA